MRVLGIDPATLLAADAFVEDGKPLGMEVWKGKTKDTQYRRLAEFHRWVKNECEEFEPHLVVIAESSFTRNMTTVRALARAEAVAIVAGVYTSDAVVTAKDTQIRSIVWPDEKVKKEEVYQKLKKLYPKLNWKRQDQGGQDQADALAAAIAGPVLLERKLK